MMGKIRRVANAQSVRNDSPALHCRALCFVRRVGHLRSTMADTSNAVAKRPSGARPSGSVAR